MKTIWIDTAESTNAYLREMGDAVPPMAMVCAREQKAGRGQRGNSWEAQPGMNLTFSFQFKPGGVKPAEQFAISEAVALGVADALADFGITARIKWPNDIYVEKAWGASRPGKIAGILIENSIMGDSISRSIVGIGLNVNQKLFLGDAPNPLSMTQVARREFDLREVAVVVGDRLESRLHQLGSPALHAEYLAALWRGDGRPHPFRDTATGEYFLATIDGIDPSGYLRLRLDDSTLRRYAFKEVAFVL